MFKFHFDKVEVHLGDVVYSQPQVLLVEEEDAWVGVGGWRGGGGGQF